LEEKKVQEKIHREEFSYQINILKGNESNNMQRIDKTMVEKDALVGITEDAENTSLDP